MTSEMSIRIRPETINDESAIEELTLAAFMNAEHSNHNEQVIVSDLREANQLSISLVAEEEPLKSIVGHVAVSPVAVSDGSENWDGLGPISVLPQHQGNSIGSLLVHRAMVELQVRHAAGCVVLGNPNYYTRFGFKPEPSLQLLGVPQEYFTAFTWRKPTPTGTVSYHNAFETTAIAIDGGDAL
ncbi:acyl-CoA N-acyltransferase [Penicillium longicatenatum]|nr:acyl-CoA N-acyltransferase [Penicillium longicatenatum]